MSYDLYFWASGAVEHPRRLAERLADEEVSVRVDGSADPVLVARVETLLDLL